MQRRKCCSTRDERPCLQRFFARITNSSLNDKSPLPLRRASEEEQKPFQFSDITVMESSLNDSNFSKPHPDEDVSHVICEALTKFATDDLEIYFSGGEKTLID